MVDQTQPQSKKRNKGHRPKHVPVRTCVVCREHDSKRALLRIVRQPDGSVMIDPSGRLNGRGTYICDKPTCRDKATTTDVVAKALNAPLPDSVRESLRIQNLGDPDAPIVGTETQGELTA
ncbi:MAG TPA: YlxR family protein [Thermomicrobiales bacterium]|nr:YlxR family protein [Thermomicrobiales bacterium]HRA48591.1 YlxR family protein [Thermomicrobiales bacterium]